MVRKVTLGVLSSSPHPYLLSGERRALTCFSTGCGSCHSVHSGSDLDLPGPASSGDQRWCWGPVWGLSCQAWATAGIWECLPTPRFLVPQPKHTSTLGPFLRESSRAPSPSSPRSSPSVFSSPWMRFHASAGAPPCPGQVPHHPVEVVDNLRGVSQSPGPIGDPALSLGPGMALLTAQGYLPWGSQ